MDIIPRKVNGKVDWDWLFFIVLSGVFEALCIGLLIFLAYTYYIGGL